MTSSKYYSYHQYSIFKVMIPTSQIFSSSNDQNKQKICIKFNRKQANQKSDRKKMQSHLQITDRICFISPHKNPIATISHHSPDASKILNIGEIGSNNKEQSFIRACESPRNKDHNMNDSILSLMNELKGSNERKYQNEVHQYFMEIMGLREEVEQLQVQNRQLKEKVKDFQYLQNFVIERQSYISEVTQKNISINEKLLHTKQQKSRIEQQLKNLQNDYVNEQQALQNYIKSLKQEIQIKSNEFDMILKLNIQLNQKLQERKKRDRARRKKQKMEHQEASKSLTKSKSINFIPILHSVDKQNDGKRNTLQMSYLPQQSVTFRTKETDLSELNVKSMDEFSILQRMNDPVQSCDCKEQMKKLRQKIRYNEIQIDILKRIKLNSQKIKQDNERLKKQNQKLLCRIQTLTKPAAKQTKKRKKSDSSLQLSLSPKKR